MYHLFLKQICTTFSVLQLFRYLYFWWVCFVDLTRPSTGRKPWNAIVLRIYIQCCWLWNHNDQVCPHAQSLLVCFNFVKVGIPGHWVALMTITIQNTWIHNDLMNFLFWMNFAKVVSYFNFVKALSKNPFVYIWMKTDTKQFLFCAKSCSTHILIF